jgi:urea carboxylase
MPAEGERPRIVYRRAGDRYLLIEYGPMMLDLELRFRVHALMRALETRRIEGLIDLTPGIRSLQVHFDSRVLPQARLLQALADAEDRLGGLDDFAIPSRVVRLPLSWKDPAIYETIDKYMAVVRDDAPWCPDNIEFIRRINGLDNVEAVREIVLGATYLVLGLGDVYLGAPVATPLDPRHRLVTTKYNPARTWTASNAVGIGGAYMCIYGMEGPGGYQLVGRTLQVWSTHRETRSFRDRKPWLLRFFDQIRFFDVSAEELVEWRREFPLGRRDIVIEPTVFRTRDYRAFADENRVAIRDFEMKRTQAFAQERTRWAQNGEYLRAVEFTPDETRHLTPPATFVEGSEIVEAPFAGLIWRINVRLGERIAKGDAVAIVEAMKMECQIYSPVDGVVRRICVTERQPVEQGAPIVLVELDGYHPDGSRPA